MNKRIGGVNPERDRALTYAVLRGAPRRTLRRRMADGWGRVLASRVFWETRLGFIAANAPFILYMQMYHPDWLVPYLVWMSWATWLSSELPTKEEK